MRTEVSAEAGRGRATVPPPQASPSVYTALEKDPRQGLRCLRCGPFRAPCPGFPIPWVRRRSPLSFIPWRRHGSHPGEAQSEKAACCGWVMTSVGWRSACCAGPCGPPAPLGLAGGGEPWRPGLHRSLARGRGMAVCRGLAGVFPLPPPPPPPCEAASWLLPCAIQKLRKQHLPSL